MQNITTSQLESLNSLSVWVLNNANPPGSINLSINDGTGQMIPITIPLTWIPIDLTTQATKTAVITNPQFRRLVASNMLLLLTEEDAQEKLQSADAQEENRRIYSSNVSQNSEFNMPKQIKEEIKAAEAKVSGFILNIVARKDIDESACLGALKSQAHTFSKDDLEYLVNNSTYGDVKAWASSKL